MNEQSLVDQFALQQLAYRYASAVDQRDAAALAACFDDEVFIASPGAEMRGNGGEIAQQIAAFLVQTFVWTMHNVHNIEYVIDGDNATGSVYCVASHVSSKAGAFEKLDWYIRYTDKVVKRDGEWRYSERRLECRFAATEAVQPLGVI